MFKAIVRAAIVMGGMHVGPFALAASADDSAGPRAESLAEKPVAVLNFANRGQGDPTWDWLGKGLADLTIGDLTSQNFRVISREQMQEMLDELALKRSQTDPEAALKVLKVTRYVQGSYLIDNDRVELNASIIKADTGPRAASSTAHPSKFYQAQSSTPFQWGSIFCVWTIRHSRSNLSRYSRSKRAQKRNWRSPPPPYPHPRS
jgi:TolB-like protein